MANSIRKVSEDPKLRPFLSSHFDSQTYIKTVIKEGRSEECFNTVTTCIEEVNEEIKGYISQNKDVLMTGMQDVALLSERYSLLYSTSQKLQRNVDRLKKEALESYDLVKLRTMELERMHTTSMLLRQLRHFFHCKAQLEHLLNAAGEVGGIKGSSKVNNDIRHLSSSAKALYELEIILAVPALLEHVKSIQDFGRQLKELAKEKLLSALTERNQAYVAASLQVFFNLQSLPEIVLMAIDGTVKTTLELSRAVLDFDSLVGSYPELQAPAGPVHGHGLSGRGAVHAALATASSMSSKKSAVTPVVVQQPNSSQLRTAMKEMAREWCAVITDQAMQVHVLQRVIAKKEDPTTHTKFSDVLEGVGQNNLALAQNRLLDLFWARLQSCFQEVASEKLKAHPLAASRIYPYLRKVAVEAVENLRILSSRDLNRDALTGYTGGSNRLHGLGGDSGYGEESVVPQGWGGVGSFIVGGEQAAGEGMFGSAAWTGTGTGTGGGARSERNRGGHELLGCLGAGGRRVGRNSIQGRHSITAQSEEGSPRKHRELRGRDGERFTPFDDEDDEDHIAEAENKYLQQAEGGLVGGLKPLRDRYLTGSLSRMTGPVLQMFPEMEGYTAAVPSKRDMQTLIRSVQTELGMAAAEGDKQGGLLRAVCKEAVKAVQLMVSKVEGMVQHKPDSVRIVAPIGSTPGHSGGVGGGVSRTSVQEHNAQLLGLLAQLRDALERTPSYVLAKALHDSIDSGLGGDKDKDNNKDKERDHEKEKEKEKEDEEQNNSLSLLTKAMNNAIVFIDSVITKQLLAPLLAAVTAHLKTILLPLVKEGVVAAPVRTPTHVQHGESIGVDCSRPVQALLTILPDIMKIHILSLHSCPPVTSAVEELGLRILHLYVTIAALIRPVSEQARLRTAREMGALEAALAGAGISLAGSVEANPVMLEFRSFRRLLFMDDATEQQASTSSTTSSTSTIRGMDNKSSAPPSRTKLQGLPFVKDLRPSVLIGYLTSCGPTQIPSPYLHSSSTPGITDPSSLLSIYVDALTILSSDTGLEKNTAFPSVAAFYIKKSLSDRLGVERDWGEIPGETKAWESVQGSLDVYVQRISVAEAQQKAYMRAWYESLQEIGGLYYGNNLLVQ